MSVIFNAMTKIFKSEIRIVNDSTIQWSARDSRKLAGLDSTAPSRLT